MNTTGQKIYWDWLKTFAAGRPFKADDEFSEDGRLQIHFEPPVLLDAPHGNAKLRERKLSKTELQQSGAKCAEARYASGRVS